MIHEGDRRQKRADFFYLVEDNMGLSAAAVQLNLELWRRGLLKGIKSAADIGSQELHLSKTDFDALVASYAVEGYDPAQFEPWGWPGTPRCSARHLYKLLGVPDYACIDMNGEHGAIPLDLNKELTDTKLRNRFDMITDHGCNEHIFNASEAFRTMHWLCKPDGLIVICQQLYRGNGYYLFEPSFFEGLAAANSYKVLFTSFSVTLKEKTENGSNHQYHIPLSYELIEALEWTKLHGIGINYVMQKTSAADFKLPYQDSYMSEKHGNRGYALQFDLRPPSRSYVPLQDLGGLKGAELVTELKRRVRRKLGA